MAMKSTRDRMNNEVNAGSMADIAFLLLIFFLVTTTIVEDAGILVKLPPWSEDEPDITKLNERNVFSVLVNASDDLLVRNEREELKNLKQRAVEFITNPYNDPTLSEAPTKAIISLKNDRGTHYETYLEVYNELKAAYNQIWQDESQKRYGKDYEEVDTAKKRAIRKDFPLVLSEAEPTSFGKEE